MLGCLAALCLGLGGARTAVAVEDAAAPDPPPAAAAPATQPLTGPFLQGTQLQPGEPGYKSPAIGAGWSFGATLLPAIIGGFAARAQSELTMWIGFGLIVSGQSFGPSAGFWYANERARFTWERFALTLGAFGAALYPLYAYTGHLNDYNSGLAAGLVVLAVSAEAGALALAAWDLSLLGEVIDRHNFRPAKPPATTPERSGVGARIGALVPFAVPHGGGVSVGGLF